MPVANHTRLSELPLEHEGLALSRFTVRRILEAAGMSSPRRRRQPEHRVRRERIPHAGMLLQLDGSHLPWLQARGPRFTLLLAVDDATGDVPYALFRPAEDARGYFSLMEQVVLRRGLPLTLYTDLHGVFLAPPGRAGRRPPTQFARSLGELGITEDFADSPQAKGRVERFAGTLQNRLVTGLRHAGAATIAEAQELIDRFLPRFNTHFRVQPARIASVGPASAWALSDVRPRDSVYCFGSR
ncbi:MAG: transposase family protein [Chloroflexi bacterium]|nr:transposase family protein [Chloroflexota bacterium]